jgi:hypothetical protein
MRALLLVVVLTVAACGPSEGEDVAPPTSVVPMSTSTTTTTAPTTTTAAPEATFRSEVRTIDDATATRMATSWRPGCPVGLEDLRYIALTHWGFDGQVHDGEVVVRRDAADAIVSVFSTLFDERFPLEQVRLVDDFSGDDDRSMAANNTSAFNCRAATGSSRWSEHAYGRAIDLNPIQNPFVTRGGSVLPPEGAAFADRHAAPGVITGDSPVVDAFARIGWEWGGHWSSGKDYQHFSATGR